MSSSLQPQLRQSASFMYRNTYPLPMPIDSSHSLLASVSLEDYSYPSMSKLIDSLTQSLNQEPCELSIDKCLAELQELQQILDSIEDKNIPFNIASCKEYKVALNLLLLYTSTYPNPDVKGKGMTPLPCNIFNLNPQIKPADMPAALSSVNTRLTDKVAILDNFHRLCDERHAPADSGKQDNYMINVLDTIKNVTDLCDMFTQLKDIEKLSVTIQHLKDMRTLASKHALKKSETYSKLKDMKKHLNQWEEHSAQIYKTITELNDITACNDQTRENIKCIDSTFNSNVTEVIHQLPIERLRDELILSHSLLSLCTTLSKPFSDQPLQLSSLECPVCISESNGDNMVAITACGHVLCQSCVDRVDTCPVCRAPFTPLNTLKLFFKN
jgi:hypothetical protein